MKKQLNLEKNYVKTPKRFIYKALQDRNFEEMVETQNCESGDSDNSRFEQKPQNYAFLLQEQAFFPES